MRSLYITFFFSILFISCRQKNCNPTDYHSINWEIIDSTTSYFICSNSDTILNPRDFINIEYLGNLQKDENLVIQRETDIAYFALFKNVKFGRVNINDTSLPKDIRFVLNRLTKNGEATIKYDWGNNQFLPPDRIITVFFKNNVDSIAAGKWIDGIKRKPFVDSAIYLSKDAALSKWSNEEDSNFISFLGYNPLPTSVDFFIKANRFDTAFIHGLKEELMKSAVVSDIRYRGPIAENLKEFNKWLSTSFLIRVKS